MEIVLNFAWALLALVIILFWFPLEHGSGQDRSRQIIAILLLVAVLFPAISVTDDLLLMQNATEVDNCHRRDYLLPVPSDSPLPMIAAISPSLFTGTPLTFLRFVAPTSRALHEFEEPDLPSIQNRPPPVA